MTDPNSSKKQPLDPEIQESQDSSKKPRLEDHETLVAMFKQQQQQLLEQQKHLEAQRQQIDLLTNQLQNSTLNSPASSSSSTARTFNFNSEDTAYSSNNNSNPQQAPSPDPMTTEQLINSIKHYQLHPGLQPNAFVDIQPPGSAFSKYLNLVSSLKPDLSNFTSFLEQFYFTLNNMGVNDANLLKIFGGVAKPGPTLDRTARQIFYHKLAEHKTCLQMVQSSPVTDNFMVILRKLLTIFTSSDTQQPSKVHAILQQTKFKPGANFWNYCSSYRTKATLLLNAGYTPPIMLKDMFLTSLQQDQNLTSQCRFATVQTIDFNYVVDQSLSVYRNLYPNGHPDARNHSPFYHVPSNNQNRRDTRPINDYTDKWIKFLTYFQQRRKCHKCNKDSPDTIRHPNCPARLQQCSHCHKTGHFKDCCFKLFCTSPSLFNITPSPSADTSTPAAVPASTEAPATTPANSKPPETPPCFGEQFDFYHIEDTVPANDTTPSDAEIALDREK